MKQEQLSYSEGVVQELLIVYMAKVSPFSCSMILLQFTSLLILPRVVLFVIFSRMSSILLAEGQLPLHLFLSSNNLKSLDDARLLAEHLLDTISVECGVSR